MLKILTLSLHIFIAFYLYRKFYVVKKNWDVNFTMFYILIYYLLLNIYWVGDLEDLDWWEAFAYKFIWVIFLIIYTYNFFLTFNILRSGIFVREGEPHVWLMYSMRIQSVFIYFWTKSMRNLILKDTEINWYTHQIRYNKTIKSKLSIFLFLFSNIFILVKILLIVFIILYSFFIIHTPLTPITVIVEKYHVNIFFFFIKFYILYKIVFSIFLKNTSLYWIFFFYSPNYEYHFSDQYKYDWYFNYLLTMHALDIPAYYGNGLYSAIRLEGGQKRNFDNRNLNILFSEWGPPRFKVPRQWKSVNYKVIGKLVNTKYFNFWLLFQRMSSYLNHPEYYLKRELRKISPRTADKIPDGFGKYINKVKFRKFYTYDDNIKFEKNLKKYRIK